MMKRFDNLYPTLTSFENLWLAARKAARGKRGQPAVAAFEMASLSSVVGENDGASSQRSSGSCGA